MLQFSGPSSSCILHSTHLLLSRQSWSHHPCNNFTGYRSPHWQYMSQIWSLILVKLQRANNTSSKRSKILKLLISYLTKRKQINNPISGQVELDTPLRKADWFFLTCKMHEYWTRIDKGLQLKRIYSSGIPSLQILHKKKNTQSFFLMPYEWGLTLKFLVLSQEILIVKCQMILKNSLAINNLKILFAESYNLLIINTSLAKQLLFLRHPLQMFTVIF